MVNCSYKLQFERVQWTVPRSLVWSFQQYDGDGFSNFLLLTPIVLQSVERARE